MQIVLYLCNCFCLHLLHHGFCWTKQVYLQDFRWARWRCSSGHCALTFALASLEELFLPNSKKHIHFLRLFVIGLFFVFIPELHRFAMRNWIVHFFGGELRCSLSIRTIFALLLFFQDMRNILPQEWLGKEGMWMHMGACGSWHRRPEARGRLPGGLGRLHHEGHRCRCLGARGRGGMGAEWRGINW